MTKIIFKPVAGHESGLIAYDRYSQHEVIVCQECHLNIGQKGIVIRGFPRDRTENTACIVTAVDKDVGLIVGGVYDIEKVALIRKGEKVEITREDVSGGYMEVYEAASMESTT